MYDEILVCDAVDGKFTTYIKNGVVEYKVKVTVKDSRLILFNE